MLNVQAGQDSYWVIIKEINKNPLCFSTSSSIYQETPASTDHCIDVNTPRHLESFQENNQEEKNKEEKRGTFGMDSSSNHGSLKDEVQGVNIALNHKCWVMRKEQENSECTSETLKEPVNIMHCSDDSQERESCDEINNLDLSKLSMDRKLGRPRKKPKVSYFFEVRGKSKKKIQSKSPLVKIQNHLSATSKADELALVPVLKKEEKSEREDCLVEQILEAGEIMGLIHLEEKENAKEVISNNLSD